MMKGGHGQIKLDNNWDACDYPFCALHVTTTCVCVCVCVRVHACACVSVYALVITEQPKFYRQIN